jgi:hypothetical protein
MRTRLRTALALAVAASAALAAPARAGSAASFDWYGLGGCTVPVVGMPIDFRNVAPIIPADHHSRVFTLGTGEQRQAMLIFLFSRCPTSSLQTESATVSSRDVVQVMVGVLYGAGTARDADKAQFYLLSSAVDWGLFVLAEKRIGLPTYLVPDLRMRISRDPLTGLGSFVASVPAGAATLTAAGRLLAPNPVREFPLDAAHFFQGPLGLVRVHHDESWAAGNEATGTISAPAGSSVAGWMGATARDVIGLYYWDDVKKHVHRYALVGETGRPAPPTVGSAPSARTRCAAFRRRNGKRRVRCTVHLPQDAELTIRLTRGDRLYAYAKRSLRAGTVALILRPRRRLIAGTYRLAVSVRAPGGSSTTRKSFRVPRRQRR